MQAVFGQLRCDRTLTLVVVVYSSSAVHMWSAREDDLPNYCATKQLNNSHKTSLVDEMQYGRRRMLLKPFFRIPEKISDGQRTSLTGVERSFSASTKPKRVHGHMEQRRRRDSVLTRVQYTFAVNTGSLQAWVRCTSRKVLDISYS